MITLLYPVFLQINEDSKSSGFRDLFQGLFGLLLLISIGIYAAYRIKKNNQQKNNSK